MENAEKSSSWCYTKRERESALLVWLSVLCCVFVNSARGSLIPRGTFVADFQKQKTSGFSRKFHVIYLCLSTKSQSNLSLRTKPGPAILHLLTFDTRRTVSKHPFYHHHHQQQQQQQHESRSPPRSNHHGRHDLEWYVTSVAWRVAC